MVSGVAPSTSGLKPPTFLPHQVIHHVNSDDIFQALQLTHNEGPVSPGASQRGRRGDTFQPLP